MTGIGCAMGGGAFFAWRNGGRSGTGRLVGAEEPVVVLMDSPVAKAVYDEDMHKAGRTNAEILQNSVLNILPVNCVQSTISEGASRPDWRGENNMIKLRPQLVLIHRSAFFHPVNTVLGFGYPPFTGPDTKEKTEKWDYAYGVSDEKLICFIGYVATVVPGCRFFIYSRGTDERWKGEDFRDRWKKNCEARFPTLTNRVYTLLIKPSTIPGSERGTFKDPETADEMRRLVRTILDLP